MTRFWPLAVLLALLAMLATPRTASASSALQPETRVGGFDLVALPLVGLLAAPSAQEHSGNSVAYDETARGYSLAAEGVEAAGGTVSRLGGDAYEILDGVRRAKAAAELGQETIAAEIQIGGRTVASGQVPVSSLLSPKSVIDVSTPSALQRWLSILNGTQAGDTLHRSSFSRARRAFRSPALDSASKGGRMIRWDKHDRALEAINAVLVHARMMATSRAAYEDLAAVLDVAEYLPTLFLRREDMTDHFRSVLNDSAAKYPAFQAGLERFDKP